MRRARVLAATLAVAAVGAGVFVLAKSPGPSPDSSGPAAPPRPPGIVLVCLDTLRADTLALDSGRPVRMPRLEAYARESVAFADATAPTAWTGPSVTSLLTGLDPSHTGVLGLPDRVGEPPASVATLPALLAAAGWDTAAVITGGFIDPRIRLMRGFREATVGLDQDPGAVIAGWERRRPKGVPFFLFLHSLAAHDPYLDKDERARRSGPAGGFDAARAASIRAVLAERPRTLSEADAGFLVVTAARSALARDRLSSVLGKATVDLAQGAMTRWLDDGAERDATLPAVGEALRRDYLEGLAYVDRLVGRILDGLDAASLPAGTVVIVVADHGEAFGEHGTLLHGRRLFDDVVRVPLLVRAPSRVGTPRVVHGAAGLVDVVPTVFALADLAVPAGLDGISLVPALGGAGLPARAMRAFEERRRFEGDVDRIERLDSVRTPRAKCIVRRDLSSRRVVGVDLFDLLADPGERVPLPLDRACDFGEEFAKALEATGLAVPCLHAATTPAGGAAGK